MSVVWTRANLIYPLPKMPLHVLHTSLRLIVFRLQRTVGELTAKQKNVGLMKRKNVKHTCTYCLISKIVPNSFNNCLNSTLSSSNVVARNPLTCTIVRHDSQSLKQSYIVSGKIKWACRIKSPNLTSTQNRQKWNMQNTHAFCSQMLALLMRQQFCGSNPILFL